MQNTARPSIDRGPILVAGIHDNDVMKIPTAPPTGNQQQCLIIDNNNSDSNSSNNNNHSVSANDIDINDTDTSVRRSIGVSKIGVTRQQLQPSLFEGARFLVDNRLATTWTASISLLSSPSPSPSLPLLLLLLILSLDLSRALPMSGADDDTRDDSNSLDHRNQPLQMPLTSASLSENQLNGLFDNSYVIDNKRFSEVLASRCFTSTILAQPELLEPSFVIAKPNREVRLNATASHNSILQGGYQPQKRTVIFVHGFTQSYPETDWMRNMRSLFVRLHKTDTYNLIFMDWGKAAKNPFFRYPLSATLLSTIHSSLSLPSMCAQKRGKELRL